MSLQAVAVRALVPVLILIGPFALASATMPVPARPILLELFTSEGCSSCPPADAYIASLGGRSDVLALTFHVDYWNSAAWADHLSQAAFTARQRVYSELIGAQIYTPQLVVDGRDDVVGSNRSAAAAAIDQAKRNRTDISASIARTGNEADIAIGPAASSVGKAADSRILLLTFDPLVTEAIGGGENGGRTVSYHNVVRSMRDIGKWRNETLRLHEALRGGETGSRLAVLVQESSGRVLALAATS